jgi:uncharacterized Zn-binding protein involved in type VI secretion
MKPAAHVGVSHVCPDTTPAPHVGGPVGPVNKATVFTNGTPQARIGDDAACTGAPARTDLIVEGAASVLVQGRNAAHLGNKLWHGGAIVTGSANVLIGGPTTTAAAVVAAAKDRAKCVLECAKRRLDRWNADDRALFAKWYGDSRPERRQPHARQVIRDRLDRASKALDVAQYHFGPEDPTFYEEGKRRYAPGIYAHVYRDDPKHNVYLDHHFWDSPREGDDNQSGTLLHEMSHFEDVGDTIDFAYGRDDCLRLAEEAWGAALYNADTFEYFLEDVMADPQCKC